MTRYDLDLPLRLDDVRALSPNRRGSWHGRAAAAAEVRRAVAWHVARRGKPAEAIELAVDVAVTAYYRDARRRDPDNVAGVAKPVLDGLVDAAVLLDDNATRVRRVSYGIGLDRELRPGVVRVVVELVEVDEEVAS